MELGKSEIASLSRFFRDEQKLLLKATGKLRQWLEQHFDLYHNGKTFVLNQSSKVALRKGIEQLYPRLNLLQGLPPKQTRLAVVDYVNNDKLADFKPNDHYVLVTSQAALTLYKTELLLPTGVSLRVPLAAIDITNLEAVIIVENQDVFDVWQQVNIDAKYQNALVFYRGNDSSVTKGLKTLLSLLPPNTEVLLFADLDPKGLEMAYTTPRVTGILAPSLDDIQNELSTYSQEVVYLRQLDSITYLHKQQHQGWQDLQQLILKQRFAIMQQAIVQRRLELKVFSC
ncbi:DUF7281 domain-containing protein [Paraglaciecola hydrolytica]|uniref:DUF7281 domain-containing protein n=1 Tax=Paraglaciecola hydrolytica TaxID=1799789 RepID=A0A148KLZ0_9ALTE|nr:DUF2399 domain-containing protein [Paraglaciecola hydrolytica]KXI27322.1 hypothetical protein AX660_21595 [Paraglaciecola hydrolytica]